ncbi:hypothetical protein M5689_011035 [Euphorbia peplus]|nr:hypothetical protein M5689_011035 [Euphorbia peplus]
MEVSERRNQSFEMGKKQGEVQKPKKEMNKWLKILRPKVYITDRSSFKSLVQHLTSNTNQLVSTIPQITDEEEHGLCESTSLDSIEVISHESDNYANSDGVIWMNIDQHLDSLVNIPLNQLNHECCYSQIYKEEDEVSIYDYELSGLF